MAGKVLRTYLTNIVLSMQYAMDAGLPSDSYKTIWSVSTGLYKEKGSRFLASACPVTDEEEIRSMLDDVRKEHHNARHNCYAYVLGYF